MATQAFQCLRNFLMAALLLSLPVPRCYATTFPIDAKTLDGSSVILYEDGTWRPKTLQLDHSIIRKGQFANELHKSKLGFYEFWVDRKAWQAEDASGAFEFNFAHADGEGWCGIIPERIQLTKEALRSAVLNNAKSSDPNASLAQSSNAFVNGLSGEVLEVSANMEGMYISYYMFLWSGSKGTVQIICWSGSTVIDEYRPVFNDFFGGFLLSQ
jgi:hypothetical protein